MCSQQQKTILYELLDGTNGSLQVPNTSTKYQEKLLLMHHLQETRGVQEHTINMRYDEQIQSYIIWYDSVFTRFLQYCRVDKATTEKDKKIVQDELKAFVKEKYIKELDLREIYAWYSITTICDHAFYGCSSLTSIILPDSITAIGVGSFCGCSSLTSILLPDSITAIGNGSFSGCSSLTSLILPNSITTIGGHDFYGCSSLTSVIVPDSMTVIGQGSFYGCSSLKSITLPHSITTTGVDAFPPHCVVTTKSIEQPCTHTDKKQRCS